jgi:hypothetical protein
MTYAGLMPSMEAIQQAVREPLSQAPRDYQQFAIYIFERARQIDRDWALAEAQHSPSRKGPQTLSTTGTK